MTLFGLKKQKAFVILSVHYKSSEKNGPYEEIGFLL